MPSPAIFSIRRPSVARLPIVVSAPHVGTFIPPSMALHFQPGIAETLDDTDWCVHELYAFCVDLGITLIHAAYSRYVVDLNRPTEGPALYSDARRQTDVLPLHNFSGQALYQPGHEPDAAERARRIESYHRPYHEAIKGELETLRRSHRHVLLFDAHSIRRFVPAIDSQPFPDLILGDRDGSTAAPRLSETLLQRLQQSGYGVSYNRPFKGGQITRAFGRPQEGIHALQLEMSQDIYLDDRQLQAAKVARLQPVLSEALLDLARALEAV